MLIKCDANHLWKRKSKFVNYGWKGNNDETKKKKILFVIWSCFFMPRAKMRFIYNFFSSFISCCVFYSVSFFSILFFRRPELQIHTFSLYSSLFLVSSFSMYKYRCPIMYERKWLYQLFFLKNTLKYQQHRKMRRSLIRFHKHKERLARNVFNFATDADDLQSREIYSKK